MKMDRKKGHRSLGKAKNKFGKKKGSKNSKKGDGAKFTWANLMYESITEESAFQKILSKIDLTGTQYEATTSSTGLVTEAEIKEIKANQEKYKHLLKIPRRPKWTSETTPDDLESLENQSYLKWRRILTILQTGQKLLLTPYERNLQIWRQLWRVVEKSDVIVQIVDARNPLMYRCLDLEYYVKEVSKNKMNMILINKADFLTDAQRKYWADYFTSQNIKVTFFSALLAAKEKVEEEIESTIADKTKELSSTKPSKHKKSRRKRFSAGESLEPSTKEVEYEREEISLEFEDFESPTKPKKHKKKRTKGFSDTEDMETFEREERLARLERNLKYLEDSKRMVPLTEILEEKIEEISAGEELENTGEEFVINSSKLLNRKELISLFRTVHTGIRRNDKIVTIGLVGYPNVGKSSTINALMTVKKVSTSATPGKTKHFQTLYLDKDILLCDCPGLVMPSFVTNRAEMIINGILPINQMRDHVPPINNVCHMIPRHVIEDHFKITIALPMEHEDPDRPPTSEELLNAYANSKGYKTRNGQPDNPRSARYVLKDFVNGKLVYAHAPPGVNQEEYHTWPERQKFHSKNHTSPAHKDRAGKTSKKALEDFDNIYFRDENWTEMSSNSQPEGRRLTKKKNKRVKS